MQTEQSNQAQPLTLPTTDSLTDQIWKNQDEAVWQAYVQPLITPSTVVLDAGGGPGRLLPRLWGAQKIVLAEPDPTYCLKARSLADCLSRGDMDMVNQLLATGFDAAIPEKIRAIAETAQPKANFQALNVPMFEPTIGDHGPFDLIICSHVVEHTPFTAFQEAIAAFYTFLKPTGKLIIYGSKAPILYHHNMIVDNATFRTEIVTREEFVRIAQINQVQTYTNFYINGLPTRYFPFDLFETVLKNPFAPALQTIFTEEFQIKPAHTEFSSTPCFDVIHWEAYHAHYYHNSMMIQGIYPEYLEIQGRLGLPLKPIESIEEAAALEKAVNQNAVLKRLQLVDMIVVAQKAA